MSKNERIQFEFKKKKFHFNFFVFKKVDLTFLIDYEIYLVKLFKCFFNEIYQPKKLSFNLKNS